MTPSSLFAAGSVTDTVFENCSAAYTRSRWLIGTSGSAAPPGACPAQADWIDSSPVASNAANVRFISLLLACMRDRAVGARAFFGDLARRHPRRGRGRGRERLTNG